MQPVAVGRVQNITQELFCKRKLVSLKLPQLNEFFSYTAQILWEDSQEP